MALIDLVAVASAIAGVYVLLMRDESVRRVRIGRRQISMSRLVGFLLATSGYVALLGLKSATPDWWLIVDEKRTEKLTSWLIEPGRLAILWFLAATCIGSAIAIVAARTRQAWLDACVVFCAGIVLLFGFLGNILAFAVSLLIGVGVGWARLATSSESRDDANSGQAVEPLLVSAAGVLLSWLLAVSLHWAIHEEAAPDRLHTTDRALPRVSSSTEVVDTLTVERPKSEATNEVWLIALSFIFLGLSGMMGMAHANRTPIKLPPPQDHNLV